MSLIKIAIIGEGVVGCSTALQILQTIPNTQVTLLSDRPFEKTCSAGPAGLFRIDEPENNEYGRTTFKWFEHLYKTRKGDETGVKLLSGHIQSDSKERLLKQQAAYGDIVYNFRFLEDREIQGMFVEPSKYCIHYTGFASEGNKYVPFLKKEILEKGGRFQQQEVKSLDDVADANYDVVINCAGLNGGKLAGDDNTVYPIRGVILQVEAPWHKHFMYRDFACFTIPKEDTVVIGSVKQDNRWDLEITDEDRNGILERYTKLHPAMRDPKIVSEWSALRPGRKSIRVEAQTRKSQKGKEYTVIHHYGHASNGFTLGWGTSAKVVELIQQSLKQH